MSAVSSSKSAARLEARVSPEIKELCQKAAAIAGVTLTDFLVLSVQKEASKVIEQHQRLKLTTEDSEAFIQALMNPGKPNEALRSAASRYQDVMSK